MAVQLYHATSMDKADSINRCGKMRPGRGGFAGGAIYFSSSIEAARRFSNRGRGGAEVIVLCRVDLGLVLQANKYSVDRNTCWSSGCDSVKIVGMDIYAHYNSKMITVCMFQSVHGSPWFPSMPELREHIQFPFRHLQFHTMSAHPVSHQNSQGQRFQGFQGQHTTCHGGGGGGECFPAHARAMMEDGSWLALEKLSVGDKVCALSRDGVVISEVYAFGHRDPCGFAEFRIIVCDTGHRLAATASHLVCVIGKGFVPMMQIELGDVMHVADSCAGQVQTAAVTSICKQTYMGLFAPITLAGTIFVDGIASSCYSVLRHHSLFHFAMLPCRLLHKMSKHVAWLAHKHGGLRLKGAHIYIDMLSYFEPLVRYSGI